MELVSLGIDPEKTRGVATREKHCLNSVIKISKQIKQVFLLNGVTAAMISQIDHLSSNTFAIISGFPTYFAK